MGLAVKVGRGVSVGWGVSTAAHSKPAVDFPPLRTFWFSGPAWSDGVQTHHVNGTPVRIYNSAKTVADSFKYRHKLCLDIALEALRFYRERPDFQVDALLHYARICRVENVIRPYLEALL